MRYILVNGDSTLSTLSHSAPGWSYFKRCAGRLAAVLVLRLCCGGLFARGVWNILDALLVLFMLADAVCALMGVFMFGLDDGGLMRLYRVLRLVRVARMARLSLSCTSAPTFSILHFPGLYGRTDLSSRRGPLQDVFSFPSVKDTPRIHR